VSPPRTLRAQRSGVVSLRPLRPRRLIRPSSSTVTPPRRRATGHCGTAAGRLSSRPGRRRLRRRRLGPPGWAETDVRRSSHEVRAHGQRVPPRPHRRQRLGLGPRPGAPRRGRRLRLRLAPRPFHVGRHDRPRRRHADPGGLPVPGRPGGQHRAAQARHPRQRGALPQPCPAREDGHHPRHHEPRAGDPRHRGRLGEVRVRRLRLAVPRRARPYAGPARRGGDRPPEVGVVAGRLRRDGVRDPGRAQRSAARPAAAPAGRS
jgi:hypothetical protein